MELLVLLLLGCIVYFLRKYSKIQRITAFSLSQIDEMDGIEFEHYVCHLLKARGYKARVTASSSDMGVDIVASFNGDKYAIQVKRHSGSVSRRAVSDAVAGMGYYRCNKSMVITNSTFTKGAYELAFANSCILVNRAKLSAWIIAHHKNFPELEMEVNVEERESSPSYNQVAVPKKEKSIRSERGDENSTPFDQEILRIAKRSYPRDKELYLQEYQDQLSSKKFMQNVAQDEVKAIALKEYPDDYILQESEYKEQLSAKQYMSKASDSQIKRMVEAEYPYDYVLQENSYREELASKAFMASIPDTSRKRTIEKEWPNSYSMQEYCYRNN